MNPTNLILAPKNPPQKQLIKKESTNHHEQQMNTLATISECKLIKDISFHIFFYCSVFIGVKEMESIRAPQLRNR